jgi:indole-3-glycerol phosphate synthase
VSGKTPDLLSAVLGATRRRVVEAREAVPFDRLKAEPAAPRRGVLRAALSDPDRINVIAECKRRSPARGVLRWAYDPATIAAGYERAGAAALSVLTEPGFFDGSLDHLKAVRNAVQLPVLRKDFTVDPYQIWEARAAGADAVLLIVAALDDAELLGLMNEAREAQLDALVEVHDEEELGRALAAGADLVGVNNRDLKSLAVSLDTSRRLAPLLPSGVVAVAESGLRTAADLLMLQALGYRGFLIGERFMSAEEPGAALASLLADASAGAGQPGVAARGDKGRMPCA